MRAVAGAGAVIFYDCRRWLRRLASGVSIAATGLHRAGEGLCVCRASALVGQNGLIV